MQGGRFSIYIFTKYIKTAAFQTSPVEKKNKEKNDLNLKFQASNSKFQAETIVSFRLKQE